VGSTAGVGACSECSADACLNSSATPASCWKAETALGDEAGCQGSKVKMTSRLRKDMILEGFFMIFFPLIV
jgi:hypothetical protein